MRKILILAITHLLLALCIYWTTTQYLQYVHAEKMMAQAREFDRQFNEQQTEFETQFNEQHDQFAQQLKTQKKAFDRKLDDERETYYFLAIYNGCWMSATRFGLDHPAENCMNYIKQGWPYRDWAMYPRPGWDEKKLKGIIGQIQ